MDDKIGDQPSAQHIQHHDDAHSQEIKGADAEAAAHPRQQLTADELLLEKKLRRKIDLRIMPIVVLIYLMNYIDRNNYAAARLQGLEEDLGMTDQEYQIGLSTLFVGYVLMQVPSNALLNYAGRPSWYIGFFVCPAPPSALSFPHYTPFS